MRSPASVRTARAARSMAAQRVPPLRVIPCRPTPPGPAIGASCGWALPVSTALESGGFSYGSPCSSETRRISAPASCWRAASAAPTPAGPPPTITILRAGLISGDRVPASGPQRRQHGVDVVVVVGDDQHGGVGPQARQRPGELLVRF